MNTDNHKQGTTQTAYYREHSLIEQHKIVMVRDRSTPTQDMSSLKAHTAKKIFFLIKPTFH